MEIRPVGATAALVEVGTTSRAVAFAVWAGARVPSGVEVVPGAQTVLLDGMTPADASALVRRWSGSAAETAPVGPDDAGGAAAGRPVVLRTRYDGPDLPAVARTWGCTVDEVVERHRSTTFVSAFTGFAPGFAYLAGLEGLPSVSRLGSPRPRVPAGSVGLADRWCGVYPGGTPGGWLLIGTVTEAVWDVGRDEPALLAPGSPVRFVVA